MDTYVFVGPSISAEIVAAIVPGAQIYPPVQRGDLFRLKLQPGDVVLLIDGYFSHSPAIQHMEILDVLARGVRVIGSSSMGALRAAELHMCGMMGVGLVYQMYKHRTVIGDDEVAILHDPDNFVSYSEAMVNIRHNLNLAVNEGILSPDISHRVLQAVKQEWFGNRNYYRVLELVKELGSVELMEELDAFLDRCNVDLKYEDALEALHLLRHFVGYPPLEQSEILHETSHQHNLKKEFIHAGNWPHIFESDILNYCRVSIPGFPELYRKTAIVACLSSMLNKGQPVPETEGNWTERAFAETGVTASTYPEWLQENLLSEQEFLHSYIAKQRVANLCAERGMNLEELYKHLMAQAGFVSEEELDPILYPLARSPGVLWTEPIVTELKIQGLFRKGYEELMNTLKSFDSIEGYSKVYEEIHSDVVKFYCRYWKVQIRDYKQEIGRRGFADVQHFLTTAGRTLYVESIRRNSVEEVF